MSENNEEVVVNPVEQEEKQEVSTQEVEVKQVEEKDSVEKQEEHKKQILEKYMAKKSMKNKVGYIVALSISFVLAVAILLVTCIQISVKPSFLNQGEVSHYEVNFDGTTSVFNRDNKDFNKITSELNDAFSMSVLSAVFTGQTDGYFIGSEEETTTRFQTFFNNTIQNSNYVKVELSENQIVKDKDGKNHISIINSGFDQLSYNSYYFLLPDENGFQDVTIYIPVYGNAFVSGKVDETIATVTKITVNTNLYPFSEMLEKIVKA